MPLNARPKPPDPTVARDRLVEYFERDWVTNGYTRLNGNLNDLCRETGLPRKDLIRKLKGWGITVSDR